VADRPLRLYAHRGASAEAPENTLPAFERALAIGVDALELDVHQTRDGHPVVSHDPTAARMAGRPVAWKQLDLAEARRLDLGWGFVAPDGSRPFAGRGVRIPTFDELLAELPAEVVLNVDLKQATPSMVPAMLEVIRRRRAAHRVVLASFHYRTLLEVRRRGYPGPTALSQPEVMAVLGTPRALLARLPYLGTCAQVPVRAGPIVLAGPRFLARCHGLGMRVDFWTINDPGEARRLLALGADGIMTDDPAAIAPVFAGWRAAQGAASAGPS
jgi:glycerophosphoryl diester phosphodiesterase